MSENSNIEQLLAHILNPQEPVPDELGSRIERQIKQIIDMGGGGADANAVHYTADANKTAAQKQQARDNIGVSELLDTKVNSSDAVTIVKLTDGTETLAQLSARIALINTAGKHVFFDTSALNADMYLCTIFIDGTSKYRVTDAVTGKTSIGSYSASKTLATVLSEAIADLVTITVTCVTQDGVTVTGQTVTLRNGTSATAPVLATASYNGQPVSFVVAKDTTYFVSVSDTLASHFNPTTASGAATTDTSVILTYSDFTNIKTAGDIKAALNSDIDLTELVGEQITCTKGSVTLTWDVADYDSAEKEVTILLHDTLPDQMQFEPQQALAYFEDGLSAGDYCFKSGSTFYYFTLATAIPAGGQLRATTSAFTTYESQEDTVALETGNVSSTEIVGATNLGTAGSGELNHMDRVNFGSNNYAECGLRQWLNSTAPANTKMPRISKFSRPYSVNVAGFLSDLDASFIAAIENTAWKCNTNNAYEAPASLGYGVAKSLPYTVTDKVGLASEREIFGSYSGTDAGDHVFDLYVDATATDRKKYYNSSARYWWLRSPIPSRAHYERLVNTSGSAHDHGASLSHGVVPACKIKKST